MKNTISITQRCNLACSYCYITQSNSVMTPETAARVVDFIYAHQLPGEKIEIGFFGGEPLTEFELLQHCTEIVQRHPDYDADRVNLSLVTNGTFFSEPIARFVNEHNITFCLSCDGPPAIQDRSRRFADTSSSSPVVEQNLRAALASVSNVLVNAVYTPDTLANIPETVDYFISLGLRRIYLNADYSAPWSKQDADRLPEIFERLTDRYIELQLRGMPIFLSPIDSKLALLLQQGYRPNERCRMGRGEFAFAPSGNIYPCERLIGKDDGTAHCIGSVQTGLDPAALKCVSRTGATNSACQGCELSSYCMNWCGCSNYFATGYYDRVSGFLCASEQAAVRSAFTVFRGLSERLGTDFATRLLGSC